MSGVQVARDGRRRGIDGKHLLARVNRGSVEGV